MFNIFSDLLIFLIGYDIIYLENLRVSVLLFGIFVFLFLFFLSCFEFFFFVYI